MGSESVPRLAPPAPLGVLRTTERFHVAGIVQCAATAAAERRKSSKATVHTRHGLVTNLCDHVLIGPSWADQMPDGGIWCRVCVSRAHASAAGQAQSAAAYEGGHA